MSNALEILGTPLGAVPGAYMGASDIHALLGGYDVVGAPFGWPGAQFRPGAPLQFRQAAPGFPGFPSAHPMVNPQQVLAQRATYLREQAPTRSNRIILPMTSSGNITSSASVTARPQSQAYRPEKLIVGGTPSNWLIDDIKVGNRSQFAQSGSIPAEAFASSALGNEVTFETVQTAMDFVMSVTFVGTASAGEQFRAVVFGTAADH